MATRRRDRNKENAERKSPAAFQRAIDREVKPDTDELDDLFLQFNSALGREKWSSDLPIPLDPVRARKSAKTARVLRQLRSDASNFAAGLPDPAAWREFFAARVRPTFNSIFTNIKMCSECGRRFPFTTSRNICCSDECTSRKNNRGVKRATAKEKRDRLGQRLKAHVDGCQLCQAKAYCRMLGKLIAADAKLAKALEDRQERE